MFYGLSEIMAGVQYKVNSTSPFFFPHSWYHIRKGVCDKGTWFRLMATCLPGGYTFALGLKPSCKCVAPRQTCSHQTKPCSFVTDSRANIISLVREKKGEVEYPLFIEQPKQYTVILNKNCFQTLLKCLLAYYDTLLFWLLLSNKKQNSKVLKYTLFL